MKITTIKPSDYSQSPPLGEVCEGIEPLFNVAYYKRNKPERKSMHYRNGREAKNGDKVVQLDYNGNVTAVGVLHSATPGNDYCNGSIAPIQNVNTTACMCDCLHIEDVAALLKEKGLDKRPTGK